MVIKHNLTDAEWLDKFESGEIEFDLSASRSLIDLIDVRAYELLRREVADAVLGSVRLARQSGTPWAVIARELGVSEHEAAEAFAERVAAAEAQGRSLEPSTRDAPAVGFHARHLAAVEHRLRDAVAQAVGADPAVAGFVEHYLSRRDDDARPHWDPLD